MLQEVAMNRKIALTMLKEGLPFIQIDCVPNQFIAIEGEQKELIYQVETGWIKLSKISEDGKINIVDIRAPGDFIGLSTLFTNQAIRAATITAMTPCRLLAVKKSALESFLLQHPQVMAVIYAELGDMVGKLRQTKIAATQQDSYAQVRDLLVHLANNFGINIPSGRLIPVNLTHQEIADFIGLSRPRVSICLKNLLEIGFIHRKGTFYVLCNSIPDSSSKIKQG